MRAPPFTVTPEVPASEPAAVTRVPALMVVAPPKVLAPDRVRVPAPALTSEPLAPAMGPALAPAETVSSVAPRLIAPPLRFATEAAAPLRWAVPAVSVAIVAVPPTVSVPRLKLVTVASPLTVVAPPVMADEASEPAETVPPAMAEVSRPATSTVPPAMPPVVVASLAKEVWPRPPREARVTVPVVAVNRRAPTVGFALVTAPRLRPGPENVAKPAASRASVAVDLASTASRVAPLTVRPEVPPRAPADAMRSPPAMVVAPPKVLAPDRVRVPAVVLTRAAVPARFAEAVPAWTANVPAELTVSVPPAMAPPVSVTAATVSAKPPRSKMPPLTVTVPASARRSLAPSRSVPALTVVPPT